MQDHILAGLSPKENREIPPIRYEEVYKLKEEYPNIERLKLMVE